MLKIFAIILCLLPFQLTSFSQTWDPLDSIPAGLAFPVVAALHGEIHVIGGGGSSGATDIHLRYNPTTNVWDTLAPVPYLAQQPAGAVLNGKIHYFGGGYPNSGTPLDDHYAYDPSNDTWSAAASLPIPRVIMKAAAINGKIYAMSGQPDKTRVDEYNPITDTWTLKNPLPDNNFWYSALVVHDNEMYRFGGGGYTSPVNFIHKYDSTNDSWINIASLPIALHAPAGASLGGKIYITGGYNASATDVAQVFDVNTLLFKIIPPLPGARSYHEMVRIDSCIYSVGGHNNALPDMNVSLLGYCNPNIVTVDERNSEASIHVFPNPASDYISFETEDMSDLTIEIFDIIGVKRMTIQLVNKSEEIDISDLQRGIYFYRGYCKKREKTFLGKIIVAR